MFAKLYKVKTRMCQNKKAISYQAIKFTEKYLVKHFINNFMNVIAGIKND